MPGYDVATIRNFNFGLSTQKRDDDLIPGEAAVATNVHFFNNTLQKRRGYRQLLRGQKNGVDPVVRGGPPGASLFVKGDDNQIEHDFDLTAAAIASSFGSYRADFYHHRQGCIIIPQGSFDQLRMDVKTGSSGWGFDMCLWMPAFYGGASNANDYTQPSYDICVMAKGIYDDTALGPKYQWAVLLKPVGTAASGSVDYQVVLRLYEDGDLATATDFYVDTKYFKPGTKTWVAWDFSENLAPSAQIRSYFWDEYETSVTTRSQTVIGSLQTNGVGAGTYPIVVGRRSYPNIYTGTLAQERGFNGVVGELRWWWKANGADPTIPTWDIDYAGLQSEFTDTYVSTTSDSLALYFSVRAASVFSTIFLHPRKSLASVLANRGWLTGADCSWRSGGGVDILPSHITANQRDTYYDAIRGDQNAARGRYIFGGGIRVPDASRYLARALAASATSSGKLEYPRGFSVRVQFRTGNLPASSADDMNLFQFSAVRGLGGDPATDYEVAQLFSIKLRYNSGWKLRAVQDLAGGSSAIESTASILPSTTYTAIASVQFQGDGLAYIHALYIDGELESRVTGVDDVPDVSDNTNSDATGNIANDDDDRRLVHHMMLGAAVVRGTGATAGNTVVHGHYGAVLTDVQDNTWAFHNNDTPFVTGNEGAVFRGRQSMRGAILNVQIWKRPLTEAEARSMALFPPDEQKIASYGPDLLSAWAFDEGRGRLAYDKGVLQNHLPINPYPRVRPIANAIARQSKSVIDGFWEVRTRTPRDGVRGRDIYAYASGSVLRLDEYAGANFLRPISGGDQFVTSAAGLPTLFQFSDFVFLCTGEGPVLRLTRGVVTNAGLSPVWGQPQGGDQGWVEEDRDGTFQVIPQQGGGEEVFEHDALYRWRITFYDPSTGLESPPSRQVSIRIPSGLTAYDAATLLNLPRPRDKAASAIRIYRTVKNGGEFRFVDEIPIQRSYTDGKPDDELGSSIDSIFNFPPPRNARLGVMFGSRAVYSGIPEEPATFYWSKQGFPEHVPPAYQLTVTSGRSPEITGLLVMHDRCLVFLQDSVYVLFDTGGDIGVSVTDQIPVQFAPLKENVGCVSHHTIQQIEGLGAVFAGEDGLYVTDGLNFTRVSLRVLPTWETLDKASWRNWHSVHLRSEHKYLLFCRQGAGGGQNNRVLVWDYQAPDPGDGMGPGGFSLWTGIDAKFSQVVEDENTGLNRTYFSDYYGQLYELAPRDVEVNADGLVPGDLSGGTVQANSTTSVINLIAADDDTVALPTAGDGLRGVRLFLGDDTSNALEAIVLSNDDKSVTVSPLGTIPANGTRWRLGAIPAEWDSGLHNLGREDILKRVGHIQLNFEPAGGEYLQAFVQLDEETEDSFFTDPNIETERLGPVYGRGRRFRVRLKDDGGSADAENPWEVGQVDVGFYVKGRSKWTSPP